MQTLVDSFVEYMNTNVGSTVPVTYVRSSTTDAQSHRLKSDSLNISVLEFTQNASLEEALISLDILGDDERIVLGWTKSVRDVLRAQQFTTEYAYETDPEHPTSQNRMICWRGSALSFYVVASEEHYCHVNCTFSIWHTS